MYLKHSTAVDILIGPFVDKTDGATAETGESPSVKLSKNGQTLGAKNDATTPVSDADGYYNCELDATDTNTVGTLVLTIVASANALPVRHEFQVVEENVYDTWYAASADAGTLLDDVPSTSEFNARTLDAASYFNPAADTVATVTDVTNQVTALADVTWISGSAPAATNFGNMYNGTGYLDDTAPSSRAQIGNLSSGSAGIATVADGQVLTTAGAPTNDYTVTNQKNGVYHIVPPTGGQLEFYYTFNVGENGVAAKVEWVGYVQANNDFAEVWFWNWVTLTWDQVDTVAGSNGVNEQTLSFSPSIAHTGTGADLGDVRLRFTSGTLGPVVVNIATDRMLCSFSVIQDSLGFMNGAVWIDTLHGEPGTSVGIGTISRPVDNMPDARAIANANNLKRFNMNPGSAVVLSQEFADYFFEGTGSSADLGGQDISGARFTDMVVTGEGIGAGVVAFRTVLMNNVTLSNAAVMLGCPFAGTFTLGAGPNYRVQGGSVVSETANVVFDFTANSGQDNNLHMTEWSGDLEIQNMGQAGTTDKTFISGSGELTINANCIGGTVEYYGEIVIIDNSGGAVTLIGGNIQAILSDIGALNDLSVADILTTPMSESYAADGAAPSLAQAIMLVQQKVGDFKVTGTTLTVNKLDGIAAAATYTLDDAANPTSTTRST